MDREFKIKTIIASFKENNEKISLLKKNWENQQLEIKSLFNKSPCLNIKKQDESDYNSLISEENLAHSNYLEFKKIYQEYYFQNFKGMIDKLEENLINNSRNEIKLDSNLNLIENIDFELKNKKEEILSNNKQIFDSLDEANIIIEDLIKILNNTNYSDELLQSKKQKIINLETETKNLDKRFKLLKEGYINIKSTNLNMPKLFDNIKNKDLIFNRNKEDFINISTHTLNIENKIKKLNCQLIKIKNQKNEEFFNKNILNQII